MGHLPLAITRAELPAQSKFSVRLREHESVVVFRTAEGRRFEHPLSFERGWGHFSLRANVNGAVLSECIVSDHAMNDASRLPVLSPEVRFQPFFMFD